MSFESEYSLLTADSNKTFFELTIENENLRSKLNQAAMKGENIIDTLNDTTKELENLKKDKLSLCNDLSNMTSEIKTLKHKNCILKKHLNEALKESDVLNTELRSSVQRVKCLEEEILFEKSKTNDYFNSPGFDGFDNRRLSAVSMLSSSAIKLTTPDKCLLRRHSVGSSTPPTNELATFLSPDQTIRNLTESIISSGYKIDNESDAYPDSAIKKELEAENELLSDETNKLKERLFKEKKTNIDFKNKFELLQTEYNELMQSKRESDSKLTHIENENKMLLEKNSQLMTVMGDLNLPLSPRARDRQLYGLSEKIHRVYAGSESGPSLLDQLNNITSSPVASSISSSGSESLLLLPRSPPPANKKTRSSEAETHRNHEISDDNIKGSSIIDNHVFEEKGDRDSFQFTLSETIESKRNDDNHEIMQATITTTSTIPKNKCFRIYKLYNRIVLIVARLYLSIIYGILTPLKICGLLRVKIIQVVLFLISFIVDPESIFC